MCSETLLFFMISVDVSLNEYIQVNQSIKTKYQSDCRVFEEQKIKSSICMSSVNASVLSNYIVLLFHSRNVLTKLFLTTDPCDLLFVVASFSKLFIFVHRV